MDITPRLRLIDLPVALADPTVPQERRTVYQHAYDQVVGYIDSYGARHAGLVVPA
jgi:poly-gamma-glutamate synthesis protein (capsule biosynthesis protein)